MSILLEQIPHPQLQNMLSHTSWYHQFDFPQGLKQSDATYHLKPYLAFYQLPTNLAGQRVLDVGTADGFFAFELKQRGADEVVGIDINPFDGNLGSAASPKHEANITKKYSIFSQYYQQFPEICTALGLNTFNRFRIAQDLLDLDINYREQSVYDLKASGEKFDLVFCGDLIEHLKNPLEALENLAAATQGCCIIALSGALTTLTHPRTRLWERVARLTKTPLTKAKPEYWVEYIGNTSGGAFFHFHPLAFREALLASGFNRVEIISEFDLPNQKHKNLSHHAIFHCYV